VGSKEGRTPEPLSVLSTKLFVTGWTPSTFVSSRSDRAKNRKARPEDFMDEEDLAEIKESRNLVDTNEEMDILGATQAEINLRGGDEESEDA
jgi:G patch domain-containing protein 1